MKISKYPDTMFLTQKGAEEHLKANNYHCSEDTHTYAMTVWRSPEVERLWKILQEVNWQNVVTYDYCPEVWFVLYDEMDENNRNGWIVSDTHEVIDMCEQGFFTGSKDDFPYNADFTRWEEVGSSVFFDKGEAEEKVEKLAGMGLGEKEGYQWMEERAKDGH